MEYQVVERNYNHGPNTARFNPYLHTGRAFSRLSYFGVAVQHVSNRSGWITVLAGGLEFAAPQTVPPWAINLAYPGQETSGSGASGSGCDDIDSSADEIPFLHWAAPQGGWFMAPGSFAFVVSCAPVRLKFRVLGELGVPPGMGSSSSGY